jgi:hypothetical protein
MSQTTRHPGRHRSAPIRRISPQTLLSAVRRPTHRGLLKTTGGLVAAVGLLSAWTGPVSAGSMFDLANAPTAPASAAVRAPAAALTAPSWGQIGFRATAKKAKPPTATPTTTAARTPTTERTERAASRSVRRTGLRGELGLSQHGLIVLNAIRDNCPGVTSFGGFRAGDMDHGSGNAVDAMVSSRGAGDSVASYVIAHAAELNVKYVIWYQRIWYPSSGTWKPMGDRGGPTANHMDHVHVSVN